MSCLSKIAAISVRSAALLRVAGPSSSKNRCPPPGAKTTRSSLDWFAALRRSWSSIACQPNICDTPTGAQRHRDASDPGDLFIWAICAERYGSAVRRCQTVATARPEKRRATYIKAGFAALFQCARVDSNHHGPNGPQGPQPDPRAVDGSGSVQIVQFVGFRGRIGRIWRSGFCQSFVTRAPNARGGPCSASAPSYGAGAARPPLERVIPDLVPARVVSPGTSRHGTEGLLPARRRCSCSPRAAV
jgi:hypothetical protein